MPSTVLIVEDDPHALELVRLYLVRDGHQVQTAPDGLQGLRLAREVRPDLVVLDLMLPGLDGRELCRILRQESDVPIVMLTARAGEDDRLAGLDLGADDYVTKPFSPRELAARVKAVLRRTSHEAAKPGLANLTWGTVVVDQSQRAVHVDGQQAHLTPTEFRLLVMMMGEPRRVFTREQIIERVFGYDFDGFDRTVDAHVSSLRRKLQQSGEKSSHIRTNYIHTIYGVGYKFGDA